MHRSLGKKSGDTIRKIEAEKRDALVRPLARQAELAPHRDLSIARINFFELRLTLQGPVIPKGKGYDVLGTPKVFRTLISGSIPAGRPGNATLIWPSTFLQLTNN